MKILALLLSSLLDLSMVSAQYNASSIEITSHSNTSVRVENKSWQTINDFFAEEWSYFGFSTIKGVLSIGNFKNSSLSYYLVEPGISCTFFHHDYIKIGSEFRLGLATNHNWVNTTFHLLPIIPAYEINENLFAQIGLGAYGRSFKGGTNVRAEIFCGIAYGLDENFDLSLRVGYSKGLMLSMVGSITLSK